MRSSDRRKLADKIIADYRLDSKKDVDSAADDQAAVAAHASLRKALLPDNALSAKFTTTTGPDLKEVAGTVYVGSHTGNDQRVLWVKIEEVVYPTGMFSGTTVVRSKTETSSLLAMAQSAALAAAAHP